MVFVWFHFVARSTIYRSDFHWKLIEITCKRRAETNESWIEWTSANEDPAFILLCFSVACDLSNSNNCYFFLFMVRIVHWVNFQYNQQQKQFWLNVQILLSGKMRVRSMKSQIKKYENLIRLDVWHSIQKSVISGSG